MVIPGAQSDWDRWRSSLQHLLEEHLDPQELQYRNDLAKQVEPVYQVRTGEKRGKQRQSFVQNIFFFRDTLTTINAKPR